MGGGGVGSLYGAVYGITTPKLINEWAHGLHDISMNFRIPPFIPMQGPSSDKFHHNLQIIIRTITR